MACAIRRIHHMGTSGTCRPHHANQNAAPRQQKLPVLVHQPQQMHAGLAQPQRQHRHHLHQYFRAEARVVKNDLRHIVPRQHRKHVGCDAMQVAKRGSPSIIDISPASCRARRWSCAAVGRVGLLQDVDLAVDDQHHEVAVFTLANDDFPGCARNTSMYPARLEMSSRENSAKNWDLPTRPKISLAMVVPAPCVQAWQGGS